MSDRHSEFKENRDPLSPDRLVEERPWQGMFDPQTVKKAEDPRTMNHLSHLYETWNNGYDARFYPDQQELNAIGYRAPRRSHYGADRFGLYYDDSGSPYYEVTVHRVPRYLDGQWHKENITCSCKESQNGRMCVHEAALLAYLEKMRDGHFIVTEDDYSFERRQKKIALKKRDEEEKQFRSQFDDIPLPALDFFKDRKDYTGLHIYDMRTALEDMTTDAYSMARARELLKNPSWYNVEFTEDSDRHGKRIAEAVLRITDSVTNRWYDAGGMTITGNRIHVETADGYRNSSDYDGPYLSGDILDDGLEEEQKEGYLNINGLVLCSLLWDYCDQVSEKEKDLTDHNARKFFASFEKAEEETVRQVEVPEEPRRKAVSLYPRIIMDYGDVQLSFRIEKAGGKRMVVKNLNALVAAVNDRKVLELSKKESIDFNEVQFTDASEPLYDFIARRIGEVHDANVSFENKNSYSTRIVHTLSVTSSLALKGALLDGFYDAWQGHDSEFTDKSNDIKSVEIPIGHKPLRFGLKAEKVTDARGTFAGVAVEGLIPVMLKGSGSHRYTLNARGLSRITEEEQKQLKPFDAISDSSGYFRFQVGLDNMQEFYYRIVPSFLENPVVSFDDRCEEEAEKHLPPEPSFDFWLDCESPDDETDDYLLSAKAEVSYKDAKEQTVRKYRVLDQKQDHAYRDETQEKRVNRMLCRFFPEHQKGYYSAEITDEQFFDFLTGGISVLEKYGTVHGTEAFRIHHVRPVPVVKLGVSVESGIMDLSLTSQSLSQDELLDVLKSYHQRKRFHRLKSGDYLDLTEDSQLAEIQDMLAGLDVSEEELVKKSAKLPLYRALYLEKMLEEHHEIVSSRDRVYRSLIRNFATVKDAETEPPAGLEEVLRPYQTYGFKWMKTLENAGFGGILADEMGLGKTLQMISVLLDDYQNHRTEKPSLIVCPASLVYNWQEEFEKFAGDMKIIPITGGTALRKKALAAWDYTQVYIISYDLLKRNIAEFKERDFWYVVLDEAQYIKNASAAVSKSVKILKAEHRFALTGTPIENRLSELWSIFDFLMPGFLYSHKEFEQRFDTPITKGKDEEAAEKLKNMTSPFILRRRKEDVLQDLPEKLEEVRYVPIQGKQQKLYDAEVLKLRGEIEDEDETNNKIQVFAELTKIREICCDPSLLFDDYDGESAKRSACMDLIHQAMDGGHRMLVFSQFTSMLALLEKDLQEEGIPYYILTGSTSKEKRIQMVHAFNENDVPVFLISLKAGGTGLNLTGADVVIHYDPWWNLAAQNQATDRTHRIGQTKQVTEYKLIMKNTIEEKILDLQESKKDLAESVLSGAGQSITSLSKEELLALLD